MKMHSSSPTTLTVFVNAKGGDVACFSTINNEYLKLIEKIYLSRLARFIYFQVFWTHSFIYLQKIKINKN